MTLIISLTPIRQEAIRKARKILEENPIFLDTETTGLTKDDVVIEVAIVNSMGEKVLNSLVRPVIPIPPDATLIHGITNEMVRTAPFWPEVWIALQKLMTEDPVAGYNADFDLRLFQQTHSRHAKIWPPEIRFFDIMKIFSEFIGDWNPVHRGYRYFKLEDAGRIMNIPLPNTHRALADALLARELLIRIAAE